MIDPHVHCRDWNQSHKETIKHALHVAEMVGLSGIFDMPNTDPSVTTRKLAEERLELARQADSPVFYGLYMGVTKDPGQIKEIVRAWKELFPKIWDKIGVIGLKMFAGHSVGNLGIIKEEDQKLVYKTLAETGFDGVLAVHCEKESFIKPELWNSSKPISHCRSRPPESELESIKDQIEFSKEAGFKGHLHICHASTTQSIELIDEARQQGRRISCGVTPHHFMLDESYMNRENGLLYKVNPPLRDKESARKMISFIREGKIDWIETDHAPHLLREKLNTPFMSGFPGLPFYPRFINNLKQVGCSEELLREITHSNIENVFKIRIKDLSKEPDLNMHTEYEFNVYENGKDTARK